MLSKNKTTKFLFLTMVLSVFLSVFVLFSPVSAVCPDNVVPNPLNPNCDPNVNLTLGFIINRFLVFLPYIVTIITVGTIAWGAFKIIIAGDTDKRDEGFKIIINAVIGAVIFSSIWLILFIISLLTGFNLVSLF